MAQGETSQQKSQQGSGLEGSGSSGVIMGGPEIIIGKIASIQGDEYMVDGRRRQHHSAPCDERYEHHLHGGGRNQDVLRPRG